MICQAQGCTAKATATALVGFACDVCEVRVCSGHQAFYAAIDVPDEWEQEVEIDRAEREAERRWELEAR